MSQTCGAAGAVDEAEQPNDTFAWIEIGTGPATQQTTLVLDIEYPAGEPSRGLADDRASGIDQDQPATSCEGEEHPAAGQSLAGVGEQKRLDVSGRDRSPVGDAAFGESPCQDTKIRDPGLDGAVGQAVASDECRAGSRTDQIVSEQNDRGSQRSWYRGQSTFATLMGSPGHLVEMATGTGPGEELIDQPRGGPW